MGNLYKFNKSYEAEIIQTLHPKEEKTNKMISLDKCTFIKVYFLAILSKLELSHFELMENYIIG